MTQDDLTERDLTERDATGAGANSTVAPEADVVDDADVVDELPADLNVAVASTDYLLPNNNRRRIPATIYLLIAVACVVLWATSADSSPLVNDGFLWVGIVLGLFAAYGFVAGRTLVIDETEALDAAGRTVGFPVGHASAQMVWRGWWSRPVWRLLAYSAENPPSQRALVVVDGISGDVLEWFSEDNPEEWARADASSESASTESASTESAPTEPAPAPSGTD